jgi:tetratricopeptide (TPR) repeat protein
VEGEGAEPALEKLNLGVVERKSGDVARAIVLFEDALGFWRGYGSTEGVGFAVLNRGLALLELEDVDAARRDLEEALACFEGLGYRAQIAYALEGLAATEAAAARHVEAARLLGRAAALLSESGWMADAYRVERARKVEEAARGALGDEEFENAYAAGREGAS